MSKFAQKTRYRQTAGLMVVLTLVAMLAITAQAYYGANDDVRYEVPVAAHHEGPEQTHHEPPELAHHEAPAQTHHEPPELAHHEAPAQTHHEVPQTRLTTSQALGLRQQASETKHR